MNIQPDTVLHRKPELIVEIDSANCIRVHHDQQILQFDQYGLGLLDAFYEPRSVREGIAVVQRRLGGRRATEEIVTTLSQLVDGGLLQSAADVGFTERMFPHGGYGIAALNIAILDDPKRKRAFIRAVEDVVTPQDVVLDLGTGSGVLAMAAARAGARHVYAVEPARSGDLAAKVAADNGFEDRITFIKGWSSSLMLPEPATVITTDIVGNEAFDMLIWEVYQDARQRLAVPDVKLVPESFRASIQLVEIPETVVEKQRVTKRHIETWRNWYGFDFSAMYEIDTQRVAGFYERPEEVSQWVDMSEPTDIFVASLADDVKKFESEASVAITRTGRVNGAVLSFDAQLSPQTVLSAAPESGSRRSHWFTACWAFSEARQVSVGEQVGLGYRYQGEGLSAVWLREGGNA
ncbi:50S ribosomal protein L11 methyltransferase [Streptomyces sp. NPDC059452]|uniref:50S ribosomal protein L11 methyltransferase n=1 Tax=Streptomyces sp. NPDC059452 TaxID=3346835 RepID=UPI003694996A